MLAKAIALTNVGADVDDYDLGGPPEYIVDNAYYEFNQNATEEERDSLHDNMVHWQHNARMAAHKLTTVGQDLTLANALRVLKRKL